MTDIIQHRLGNIESAEIKSVGDLHIGDKSFLPQAITDLKKWLKEKPNRYYVLVGDIFNAATKSSVSDVYSDVMNVDDSMEYFCSQFEDIADKCLGAVDGNHDRRVWKDVGVDPVKWCCARLGIPYCGHEGNVVVALGDYGRKNRKDRLRPVYYSFLLVHGVGGGRLPGGKANALHRLREIITADAYFQGHTHTPMTFIEVIREYNSNYKAIITREQAFLMGGASLLRDGYAKAFCFAEACSRWPVLRISGVEKHMEITL